MVVSIGTILRWVKWIVFLSFFLSSFIAFAQSISFTQEEEEWIKNNPIVNHGYESNWPPYEIYEGGEYTGIVGDYLNLVEQETGIDFVPISGITWDGSIKKLKSNEIKMVPCAGITDHRKEYLYFTQPHISDPLVIVTSRDAVGFIGKLEDLNGKQLSLPENYYTGEMIERDYPNIKISYSPRILECLEDVTTGKTDAFVGSLGVVSYYMNHKGFSNLKIAAPTGYDNAQFAMAFTKDNKTLRDIVQKVLEKIPNEKHNEIRNKWISVRYEFGINMAKIKEYAAYTGLIIFLLFAIVLLWNKSLKKEISKRIIIEKDLELALAEVNKTSEERKVLLQEIHPRVKNNLQIIVSMLRLQNNEDDEVLTRKLNETITRINAISLIHEKIYLTDNLAKISLKQYVTTLSSDVVSSMSLDKNPIIIIESNVGEVALKPMIPIALILNELITNSLKYGIKNSNDGEISISLKKEGDVVVMDYSDNGTWIEPENGVTGFGHTLIDVFTEQLGGSFERFVGNGTLYRFKFNDFFH